MFGIKEGSGTLVGLKGPGWVRLVSMTSHFEPSGRGATELIFFPKKLFFVVTCSELSKLGQKSSLISEYKLI